MYHAVFCGGVSRIGSIPSLLPYPSCLLQYFPHSYSQAVVHRTQFFYSTTANSGCTVCVQFPLQNAMNNFRGRMDCRCGCWRPGHEFPLRNVFDQHGENMCEAPGDAFPDKCRCTLCGLRHYGPMDPMDRLFRITQPVTWAEAHRRSGCCNRATGGGAAAGLCHACATDADRRAEERELWVPTPIRFGFTTIDALPSNNAPGNGSSFTGSGHPSTGLHCRVPEMRPGPYSR